MKRYKLNRAFVTNTKSSSKGYRWEYAGKVDDYTEIIQNVHFNPGFVGIRITDTETGEIVKEILKTN